MKDKQIKLVIGSLLHDIGKVIYRAGDHRQHSESGCDFLKDARKDFDTEILNCVRYHHAANLRAASISGESSAYITYFADNVASAMDRRESFDASDGFDRSVPLESVFNILNGNKAKAHYKRQMLESGKGINYPFTAECAMDESFYQEVRDRIRDNLRGIEISAEYINSLLSVLEATLSYIPSSTSNREVADISLYDHVKVTAAVAECCYQYAEQNNIDDYCGFFYKDAGKTLWQEEMFLLYSMDISGIQSFIYTIGSAGALKGLRARSFYLELVMEHIIDELLAALDLSRSCLIYSGGGHCYMLLPNTERAKQIIARQQEIVNKWFMQYFDTALYIADGYAACSASNLKNEPVGSYSELFREVSRNISAKKSHRYSAEEIIGLNNRHIESREECRVCRRAAKVNGDGLCPVCAALEKLSGAILYQDYFVTVSAVDNSDYLPLPGGKFLTAADKEKLLQLMKSPDYIRSYTVNEAYTGKHVATKLWVARYTTGDTFAELARKSEGIERIAVLRGDVDNLGNTFVSGFKATGGGRYETLSRTATLSRQLSLFFKLHLNSILEKGQSRIFSSGGVRNICVVYSGGDDIFLVGAWNEVIDAFIDIRDALEKFTLGALTISGGIGIYDASYPINCMAQETAELEDYAKELPGKNAVTLFEAGESYGWQVFTQKVLKEKYKTIADYMQITQNRGKAFLYNLLSLLRDDGSRFNRARFVYYLSRMEPDRRDDNISPAEKEAYAAFSEKMYRWSTDAEERRQTVTAIYLYVYMQREKKGDNNDAD